MKAGTVDEFELIARYFTARGALREDVVLGVGDDAAIVAPTAGRSLVLTTDTLVAGRHFPTEDFPPAALGYRALAVNLSDLAAMGAAPAWALLSLTLPTVDERWIEAFASAFSALAERCNVALVGGNMALGPLTVSVTLAGQVEPGKALTRAGARVGDALYVTDALGGGAAGLRALQSGAAIDAPEVAAYAYPTPRVQAGLGLASYATAAIDVSDGLLGDLAKLLATSGDLGAELVADDIPLASGATLADALGPSDDYELLLSIPQAQLSAVNIEQLGCELHCIGRVCAEPGVRLDGDTQDAAARGFNHFQ
ncbi:MAG: thiamine-phosphate kinase [Gammaproteobacteria bacterium]